MTNARTNSNSFINNLLSIGLDSYTGARLMITLEQIKNIAEDIIADDEWINDSHTQSEHNGIKAGLYALIHHLEETEEQD
tara:strand:+ start:338 stop:577 length:240 start_codon:yes stop_codon:yes gene_type:complete